jgi:hypothetical protein
MYPLYGAWKESSRELGRKECSPYVVWIKVTYVSAFKVIYGSKVYTIPYLYTHSTLGKYFHGFCGRFTNNTKGHDYLFVVVDRFNKMCILMPCKNTINGQEATNKFFE